jgi:hypothetical protein
MSFRQKGHTYSTFARASSLAQSAQAMCPACVFVHLYVYLFVSILCVCMCVYVYVRMHACVYDVCICKIEHLQFRFMLAKDGKSAYRS